MTVTAVITAAGSGSRIGSELPKALVDCEGLSLLARAAKNLLDSGVVDFLVVSAPAGFITEARNVVNKAVSGKIPVAVTKGGASRQASVFAGIQVIMDAVDEGFGCDYVLVHDAARALVPPGVVKRVVEAIRGGHKAVIPAIPVTDTIKRVADNANSEVVETLNRESLRAVQTPQGFDLELLWTAHQRFMSLGLDESSAATDDAALVELYGEKCVVVPGDPAAFKVTTKLDLAIAKILVLRPDLKQ